MVVLYIDPGAGSLVIQALIAGMVAIPFFFRSAIARSLGRFRGNRNSGEARDGRHADDR